MRAIALICGVIGVSLGGLWLLQGLGLVHVRPILCFADCVPLQGPSRAWAAAGFVFATLGILAIRYSLRRRAA